MGSKLPLTELKQRDQGTRGFSQESKLLTIGISYELTYLNFIHWYYTLLWVFIKSWPPSILYNRRAAHNGFAYIYMNL